MTGIAPEVPHRMLGRKKLTNSNTKLKGMFTCAAGTWQPRISLTGLEIHSIGENPASFANLVRNIRLEKS